MKFPPTAKNNKKREIIDFMNQIIVLVVSRNNIAVEKVTEKQGIKV